MWLDVIIYDRFEGGRWQLPARVYARPADIYTGLDMSAGELVALLRLSGYREEARVSGPGGFRRAGAGVEMHTRQFEYWDGVEPERRLRIEFRDGRLGKIADSASGKELAIVRLEPPLIGKIYPEQDEDRVLVGEDEIPRSLTDALIAVEDRHFFAHRGIDPRGMLRALWVNLRDREIAQGGSTLTQQLVKNYFLSEERTLSRKINEIIMALLLERRYSKAEILGAYINEVYLGQHGAFGVHGFGTAAEFYFARPLGELRLDQIALLVGLVRGASYYNPRRNAERALERRDLVLQLMAEQGYLTPAEADAARKRALDLSPYPAWAHSVYPDFQDLIRRQLSRDYRHDDLRTEGLRIFSTVDVRLQEAVTAAVEAEVTELERHRGLKPGTLQVAVVVIDVNTGEILAALGGRKSRAGGFNRSLDARRPIGSLVKPFVYLTALADPARFNLISRIDDAPLRIRQPDGRLWSPRNYDGTEHGQVSLLEALVFSYNLATVRLGMAIGLEDVLRTLNRAGMETKVGAYPSLLLGAVELSPVELARLYQTLANGGFSTPLNGIRDVLDRNGAGLRRYGLSIRQALDPGAVFLTEFALSRVTTEGTGKALAQWLPGVSPVAGKTGTTNDLRDSWFAGYGSNLLAIVWLGRDDNRPMGLTGAAGAMRVWAALMKVARLEPLARQAPAEVQWLRDVNIRFEGECRRFESIPHLAGPRPDAGSECRTEWLPRGLFTSP